MSQTSAFNLNGYALSTTVRMFIFLGRIWQNSPSSAYSICVSLAVTCVDMEQVQSSANSPRHCVEALMGLWDHIMQVDDGERIERIPTLPRQITISRKKPKPHTMLLNEGNEAG
ncbi:hypothetical protein TRVL_08806 [Trypanosoma vivax]|nr:hypothetical protein TRVL_08806 [Trypanosoma vivax]